MLKDGNFKKGKKIKIEEGVTLMLRIKEES